AGQNSNNSVRVTNDFLECVTADGPWNLTRRTDGKIAKTLPAGELWDRIGLAAWASADPGLQFDTTINEWHTCPASGRINAANLGGLLMAMGIPYDSAAGRAFGGAVTALMTGSSYATSAEMAGELGAFPGYAENRAAMVRVIRNHRRAAHGVSDPKSAELPLS